MQISPPNKPYRKSNLEMTWLWIKFIFGWIRYVTWWLPGYSLFQSFEEPMKPIKPNRYDKDENPLFD